MSNKEFCVCRGCPQYWQGISDEKAERMTKTTAVNVEGELVNKTSGRPVTRKWGDSGGEAKLCGPQTERVVGMMRRNGGIQRYHSQWEKEDRLVPLGRVEDDVWGEEGYVVDAELEDYKALPVVDKTEAELQAIYFQGLFVALGDKGEV